MICNATSTVNIRMNAATGLDLPHILFVDDNQLDVHLMQMAFEPYRERLSFSSVPNMITALDYLARRGRFTGAIVPDLILLDLNLPVQNGLVLLQEIEADPVWKRIPVIVLSSSSRQTDIEEAYRMGAMLYVVKPNHWDRYIDLASSFARLAGMPAHETRIPSGRIPRR